MLPTPCIISLAMASANSEVASLLGRYKFVNQIMPLSIIRSFVYNEFDNVYKDTINTEKEMVQPYEKTQKECGRNLIII